MFQFALIRDKFPEHEIKINRRTAVRGIVCDGDRILMVKSRLGEYLFPGGGREPGEADEAALRREICEETGYADVLVGPCIGVVTEQNLDHFEADAMFVMESRFYVCALQSGKRQDCRLEGYEQELEFCAAWVTAEEALRCNEELAERVSMISVFGMDMPMAEWVARDTKVLSIWKDSLVGRILMEVRACGQKIRQADRSCLLVEGKEGHANFVTNYDKLVQQEISQRLKQVVPEAVFVGEEDDIHASIEKGFAFIVDPIDGTTNFMKDYHMSCISVGMTYDGQAVAGIVYNPYLEEFFYAEKGKGAYLNGKPIHVSKAPMEQAVIAFGTAPYYEELAKKSFEKAYEAFQLGLDIRRSGSAALDLCAVAAGRIDLYFELLLSPWDYAAGGLIVEEAGGVVTTAEGGPITLDRKCSVVATNGKTYLP